MQGAPQKPAASADVRTWLLRALIMGFAIGSFILIRLAFLQKAGADYSCFWAGAKTALEHPARLYDFSYITSLQGWPLGPIALRPYIYPPSALAVFLPFALVPYWLGYGLWVVLTFGLFVLAGHRAGAPWWFVLLPAVSLVAFCGQVAFLIGGLVILGLGLRQRPILAGILFGVAGAVKPQMLTLLPIALIALRDWRGFAATGATALALSGASALVWGAQAWLDWLSALGRFHHIIFSSKELVASGVTPYAFLSGLGLDGNWAFLLAPLAVAGVWLTFRHSRDIADQSIMLLGGAMLVSPYAMNYEMAMFAPAIALYLTWREDKAWPVYFMAGMLGLMVMAAPRYAFLAVLTLPLARLAFSWRRAAVTAQTEIAWPVLASAASLPVGASPAGAALSLKTARAVSSSWPNRPRPRGSR